MKLWIPSTSLTLVLVILGTQPKAIVVEAAPYDYGDALPTKPPTSRPVIYSGIIPTPPQTTPLPATPPPYGTAPARQGIYSAPSITTPPATLAPSTTSNHVSWDGTFEFQAATLIANNNVTGTTTAVPAYGELVKCGTQISAPGCWFQMTGDDTVTTVQTCGTLTETNFDTKISVFSKKSKACVGGNDDIDYPNNRLSTFTWKAEKGIEYYVLVHGFVDLSGDFKLCATNNLNE